MMTLSHVLVSFLRPSLSAISPGFLRINTTTVPVIHRSVMPNRAQAMNHLICPAEINKTTAMRMAPMYSLIRNRKRIFLLIRWF